MSGAIDRAARRLLHLRVLSAVLLCALTSWFAAMSGTYRVPQPLPALTTLIGGILFTLTVLLLARRVASATPSEVSGHALEIVGRCAPLVVINLIVLNVLAPILGQIATLLSGVSMLKAGLTLLGWLSGRVLFWLFALGIAGLLAVAAMRLVDRAERRWPVVARAASAMDRGIVAAAAIYCAWAMVLTFNGTFDRALATEHRSEIVRVWGVPQTPLWWADVRAWDGGGVRRILVFPERDQLVPALIGPGQRVRIRVRPGLFGLGWVESMRLDFEHDLERLVSAAPSAAAPRRWLIERLLRDGRWAEAARQTEAYARFHPRDQGFVKGVAGRLRDARQSEPAAEVDRGRLAASEARGAR